MSVILRRVTSSDLTTIAEWRNAAARYFPPGPRLSPMGQLRWYRKIYLYDTDEHAYIAEADGKDAGMLSVNAGTGEVSRVILGEDGLARQGIMSAALRAARRPGQDYWVRVLAGNDRAIGFFRKNGLRPLSAVPVDDMVYMGTRPGMGIPG